jgi:hypothetical protein
MSMARAAYPYDLTDGEWALIEPLIPEAKPGGRPRKVDMREVVNGIRCVNRTGCAWRALPHDPAAHGRETKAPPSAEGTPPLIAEDDQIDDLPDLPDNGLGGLHPGSPPLPAAKTGVPTAGPGFGLSWQKPRPSGAVVATARAKRPTIRGGTARRVSPRARRSAPG